MSSPRRKTRSQYILLSVSYCQWIGVCALMNSRHFQQEKGLLDVWMVTASLAFQVYLVCLQQPTNLRKAACPQFAIVLTILTS